MILKRIRVLPALVVVSLTVLCCDGIGNEGAFEGGPTGTKEDTKINNVVGIDDQIIGRIFDIPTGGTPSPMFNVDKDAFDVKFLRFEEFGSTEFKSISSPLATTLPRPENTQGYPDSAELDSFLSSKFMNPLPTKEPNGSGLQNPWKAIIEGYLGRTLVNPPMEGRPQSSDWYHQRWEEFPPERFFQTATTGARTNMGLRYELQSHGYHKQTEFGANGLYGDQTLAGVEPRFHPGFPVQDQSSLWTFDGTFPPKLAKTRYGEALLMRHHNALPVDVTANNGFGVHTLSTHEHNGHNPAESDGYTNAFFFPGQYYDYRWPMVLAGHDSINVDATDPRAGSPDGKGGITNIQGDYRETMSTHWFHDHMLDFTAANVYKGDAAMINYYSAIDRGNEEIDDGINLRLPSGKRLDFGNRDYDINMLIADKAWDQQGQLWFNPHNKLGFIGDQLLTNWIYHPTLDVRARRYRFRILNGSVSRFFKLALVTESSEGWAPVPFHMIANDGNIMEHAVEFPDGIMPTIGIAERYDIIIDFSNFAPGDTLYFVNLMQHKTGQSTDAIVSLDDTMSGVYDNDLVSDEEYGADPVVGKFMKMVVHEYDGTDLSMDPSEYVEGGKVMIPIRRPTPEQLATATHRTFELEKKEGEEPWGIGNDGSSEILSMDPHRVSALVTKSPDDMEVWRLLNSGSWSHPYHIHFEEAVMLSKNGKRPPPHEYYARKDVFRMGPDEDSAVVMELAYRFRDFEATFMGHCHNTQHEDHAMLLRWDVENPGTQKLLSAPIPTWDGGSLEESFGLETMRTGDGVGDTGPELHPVKEWLRGIVYGGFGPNGEDGLDDIEIGDALNPKFDERGWIDIPLRKGIMVDQGNAEIFFVLHDMSVESVAAEFGVAYAGRLHDIPDAALGGACIYDPNSDVWYFEGDFPNPVGGANQAGIDPAILHSNNYGPYRKVTIDGQVVVINAMFVKWGDNAGEQLRIDENCEFPDEPPNTSCKYQGNVWGQDTGHVVNIQATGDNPYATFKLHKSWAENGDYLPYYVIGDSYPLGTANAMGIIYVALHKFLESTAVPLVQFMPGFRLHESYPPTPEDGYGLYGGGPLGGQIGLPSYFMPGEKYSPAWHIGFAHWNENATEVVKGIDRVKQLRKEGKLIITEFPPPVVVDDFDFANLNSPHVVNCPTPITIDWVIHVARKHERGSNIFEDIE